MKFTDRILTNRRNYNFLQVPQDRGNLVKKMCIYQDVSDPGSQYNSVFYSIIQLTSTNLISDRS